MSLHGMLVPVHYCEYEYGLLLWCLPSKLILQCLCKPFFCWVVPLAWVSPLGRDIRLSGAQWKFIFRAARWGVILHLSTVRLLRSSVTSIVTDVLSVLKFTNLNHGWSWYIPGPATLYSSSSHKFASPVN